MKTIKKILKSEFSWAFVFFTSVGIIMKLTLYSDVSWGEIFSKVLGSFGVFTIESLLTIGVIICLMLLFIMLLLKIDKKRNGKFREELKIGDKVDTNHNGNCEIVDIVNDSIYVKVRVSRHLITKPKKYEKISKVS